MMCEVGTKIRIINMQGEPQYAGKEGVISHIGIDPWGDTYYSGTWGGCSVYPGTDTIEVIQDET